jgi:site-specific recombinase XerD
MFIIFYGGFSYCLSPKKTRGTTQALLHDTLELSSQSASRVKVERHGKAKVLSVEEIQRLFTKGLLTARDKALCAVLLYTGCRIQEGVTLKIADVYDRTGKLRPELVIRKGIPRGN